MFKIIGIFLASIFLLSVLFSVVSQFIFHLPYGWNIEATNSMYPLLKPGDLIFILPLIGKPYPHEIVAYKPPFLNFYVVHEVINVTKNGYITKGINNPTPDPWIVKPSWIKGFVPEIFGHPIVIPYVGYLITQIRGTLGYIVAFILLFAIYGISEIYDRNQIVIKPRRRNRMEIVDPKSMALVFLVLSFTAFMILFSPHIIYTTLMWNSVQHAPFISKQFSNNLGAVPPNSMVPITLSFNYHPFLLKLPLIILYSSSLKLQHYSLMNVTFLLYTSSPGLHSETISIEILPEFLPAIILYFLFSINPILPLVVESIEVSIVISIIVYVIMRKLT
ncbi:hypothetical protein EWF20_09935 [Sulfolobus sp. S-194]|uniref:hypothetical protein n=1 Tax=Sulfolobus sp. S-194 TaxID=2512240 RepID=UPI00143716BA|nr:hypothetical protein [Sulfolobus sp. S-194]QIW24440.1 hypothetical protein EWF20_09935 [Sulfolobus sp. S-194]